MSSPSQKNKHKRKNSPQSRPESAGETKAELSEQAGGARKDEPFVLINGRNVRLRDISTGRKVVALAISAFAIMHIWLLLVSGIRYVFDLSAVTAMCSFPCLTCVSQEFMVALWCTAMAVIVFRLWFDPARRLGIGFWALEHPFRSLSVFSVCFLPSSSFFLFVVWMVLSLILLTVTLVNSPLLPSKVSLFRIFYLTHSNAQVRWYTHIITESVLWSWTCSIALVLGIAMLIDQYFGMCVCVHVHVCYLSFVMRVWVCSAQGEEHHSVGHESCFAVDHRWSNGSCGNSIHVSVFCLFLLCFIAIVIVQLYDDYAEHNCVLVPHREYISPKINDAVCLSVCVFVCCC